MEDVLWHPWLTGQPTENAISDIVPRRKQKGSKRIKGLGLPYQMVQESTVVDILKPILQSDWATHFLVRVFVIRHIRRCSKNDQAVGQGRSLNHPRIQKTHHLFGSWATQKWSKLRRNRVPNHRNCNGQRSTDGTDDVSWDAAWWGCFLMSVSGDFPPSHAPARPKGFGPWHWHRLLVAFALQRWLCDFAQARLPGLLWHFDTLTLWHKFRTVHQDIASFWIGSGAPGWDNAAPWKPPGIPASYLKLKPLRTGKSVGLVWRSHTARKVRWSSEGIASELHRIHDMTISTIRIPWDSKLSSFDSVNLSWHTYIQFRRLQRLQNIGIHSLKIRFLLNQHHDFAWQSPQEAFRVLNCRYSSDWYPRVSAALLFQTPYVSIKGDFNILLRLCLTFVVISLISVSSHESHGHNHLFYMFLAAQPFVVALQALEAGKLFHIDYQLLSFDWCRFSRSQHTVWSNANNAKIHQISSDTYIYIYISELKLTTMQWRVWELTPIWCCAPRAT